MRVAEPLDEVARACACAALGDDAFHFEERCSILECHSGGGRGRLAGRDGKAACPSRYGFSRLMLSTGWICSWVEGRARRRYR